MSKTSLGFKHVCSECGKEFYVDMPGLYSYKMNFQYESLWQCDYTCHNHALLRANRYTKCIDYEEIVKLIKNSEETMTAKGKQILYPINYIDIEKKYPKEKPRKNKYR